MQAVRQAVRQESSQTNKQSDQQASNQKNKQLDMQAVKQPDKQAVTIAPSTKPSNLSGGRAQCFAFCKCYVNMILLKQDAGMRLMNDN
jgi:hypothetical protein